MKICVLMFYDDEMKELGDINYKINKVYCDKYNLDLIVSHKRIYEDRPSQFERIPLILKHIEQYDYCIWIDADAFFKYNADNIVNIIKDNMDKNFIFSGDLSPIVIVNTGIFIVKNSLYSIQFLNKWGYDEELYKKNTYPHWEDQGVLINMIEQNILDIQNNHITLQYGVLQHISENENKIINYFKPFILHSTGMQNNKRLEISKNYLNLLSTPSCEGYDNNSKTQNNVKRDDIIIPKWIQRRKPIEREQVIPKTLIQTYKNNRLHPFIYKNIMRMLLMNPEYEYRFITDEDGIELIKEHFDENVLNAFLKLKMGAAKGDFIRYIALYVYGGVYLDLDASIDCDLNDFIFHFDCKKELHKKDFIFFYNEDYSALIEQWIIMTKPRTEIMKCIIDEMVRRIHLGETLVLKSTGPILYTDVIYNILNNTNIYTVENNIIKQERIQFLRAINYIKNPYTNQGIFYNRQNLTKYFNFFMKNYRDNYIYRDEFKYNINMSIFESTRPYINDLNYNYF